MEPIFLPKLITTLKGGYTRSNFINDIMAGLIVGVVALPLAIAFAIASGVSPDKGLITAVVAGFIISALGGSRVQIGGPTGAFVVIVYAILTKYGLEGLIMSTFLAGIIMVLFGVLRLGSVIRYIPYPLTVGFTAGIALIIFVTQLKDLFGLTTAELPSEFIPKMKILFMSAGTFKWQAALIGGVSILITIFWQKLKVKIPGSLIALIVCTLLAYLFNMDVETIGSRFGEIPSNMPWPSMPNFDFDNILSYVSPAFTIAILGSIESLLSAVVADGMISGRHRSNTELIGQGIANMGSALFGGIPATGAIARTATNVRNGGRTPVAGIVHACTLLAIMLFLGNLAKLIPLSCLAGILVVIAYNMSEWRSFKAILKGPRYDVLVLLTTFFITVIIDLTVAIQIGMVMAAILFMKRMADISKIKTIGAVTAGDTPEDAVMQEWPEEVDVFEISGPLFFGMSNKFNDLQKSISNHSKVVVLRMRNVPMIDATGLYHFKTLLQGLEKGGKPIVLSGVSKEVFKVLEKEGIIKHIGSINVCENFDTALDRAKQLKG
ncbi:STAS domain-containing protein [Marinilabiliaceae bacterium JC017]|nr:STAS domain-containing protein [Marinilabiliaceae bacterium JC017]